MTVEIRPTTGGGSFYVIDGKYAGLASHSNPKVDVAAFNKKRGYVNPTTTSAPASAPAETKISPMSFGYTAPSSINMQDYPLVSKYLTQGYAKQAAENQPPPASSENIRPPGSMSNMERAALEIQQKIDDGLAAGRDANLDEKVMMQELYVLLMVQIY